MGMVSGTGLQNTRELRAQALERARELLAGLQPRRIAVKQNKIVAEESRVTTGSDGVYAERVIYLDGGWCVVLRRYTLVKRLGEYIVSDDFQEYVRHACGCTG